MSATTEELPAEVEEPKPVASCGTCGAVHGPDEDHVVQAPARGSEAERKLANLIRRPTLAGHVAEKVPPLLLTELADAIEAEVTHRLRMAREQDAAAVEQVVSQHVQRWESLRAERWGSGVSRG